MANPVPSVVAYEMPHGNGLGTLVLDLAWTTYAQNSDKLDLTAVIGQLPGFQPSDVIQGDGAVAATADWVTLTLNSSPTVADLGTLRVWAGATQKPAGAYAQTARVALQLRKQLPY